MLALGLAAGLIEVGPPPCPASEMVAQRLSGLLPADFQDAGRHARLVHRGDRLVVELFDAAGRVEALRDLDARSSCEDLAAAAAVVLSAAWNAAKSPVTPSPPIDFAAHRPPPAKVAPPPPPLPADIGVGFLLSLAGPKAAVGAALEAGIAPRGYRLGLHLGLFGTSLRGESFGPGTVDFTRLALSLGPRYRLSRGRIWGDLHLSGLVAAVLVEGNNYPHNSRQDGVDGGGGGGIRVGYRWGPWLPYLGLAAAGWLRPQQVQVSGISGSLTLPQVEVLLSAGVALGTFP